MNKKLLPIAAGILAATLLTACGVGNTKSSDGVAKNEEASLNNEDLYEVFEEGRLYVFDDHALYEEFLKVGETPYRKVNIGAGPNGETIVFGLTDADKKKLTGIAGPDMYFGKLAGAADFYGEMRKEGRIYVFGSLEEMNSARDMGEVPLRYTIIGGGPEGETVVIALNSENKKEKPVGLIAKFERMNGMK